MSRTQRRADDGDARRHHRAFVDRLLSLHAEAALPIGPGPAATPGGPSSDAERYAKQYSAISDAVRRVVPRGGSPVVEFGAGDGALSHALWSDRVASEFVLIDRRSQRPKAGAGRGGAAGSGGFCPEYLCVDVDALKPEALRLKTRGRRSIVLSNHMCGCALDTALRCAMAAFEPTAAGGGGGAGGGGLAGVVAVSCCHHKCTWESYLGREYFHELGLGQPEFDLVRRWTRAAPRRNKPSATRERVVQLASELGISCDGAAELGRMCRQLLDTGRARALEACGYAVQLYQHVHFSMTADNVMLLATPRGADDAAPSGHEAAAAPLGVGNAPRASPSRA